MSKETIMKTNLDYNNTKNFYTIKTSNNVVDTLDVLELTKVLNSGSTFHYHDRFGCYFGTTSTHGYYTYMQNNGSIREIIINRLTCSDQENRAIVEKFISQFDWDKNFDEQSNNYIDK